MDVRQTQVSRCGVSWHLELALALRAGHDLPGELAIVDEEKPAMRTSDLVHRMGLLNFAGWDQSRRAIVVII